jgi:hypothetical protein
MDTQIDDTALRELLLPWGQELLSRLRELICDSEKRKKHWFQIFLAIFILMNNFSFIFEDISAYTTRHGMKVCPRATMN